MIGQLIDILTYARPAGSRAEKRLIRDHILPAHPSAHYDRHGNVVITVDDAPILWSCHTDTVARVGGRQRVRITGGAVRLAEGERGNCLGADDGAGIAVCLELIRRGVPGCYVFHREEERGGIGSSAKAASSADWLRRFSAAIAIDRRGFQDIITEQHGGECASDRFAVSLARVINRDPVMLYRATHGVYTDTAEYTHLIPECTNLSCGYFGEHTAGEYVVLAHVERLADALSNVRIGDLDIARNPAARRPYRHTVIDWPARQTWQGARFQHTGARAYARDWSGRWEWEDARAAAGEWADAADAQDAPTPIEVTTPSMLRNRERIACPDCGDPLDVVYGDTDADAMVYCDTCGWLAGDEVQILDPVWTRRYR